MAPRKSWVWKYCNPSEDGKFVTCNLCDSVMSFNGSTSVIMKHLRCKHREASFITSVESHSSDAFSLSEHSDVGASCSNAQINPTVNQEKFITVKRQEQISLALTRLIAVNMMPISFCNSEGFKQFMAIVEPGYRCPCPKTMVQRLQFMYNEKRKKIEAELSSVAEIAITNDGWSSRSQDSYISTTAHFINESWNLKSYSLCTQFMEDRHSAENLSIMINMIQEDWNISNKVVAIVHDNASNICAAVNLTENVRYSVSCAAHNIQLCIKDALDAAGEFQKVIKKGSRIVQFFHHSNLAATALREKQNQLNLKQQKLIQSCPTRWSSYYYMCERLQENRCAILSILADRKITKLNIALKLDISEYYWSLINEILTVLKPFQLATTSLSSEQGVTISLVLPIVRSIITNHLKINEIDGAETKKLKSVLITSLKTRFALDCHTETVHRFASLLDPRTKLMSFETNEITDLISTSINNTIENINTPEQPENMSNTALDFIFKTESDSNSNSELETYRRENQLNHNLCPLEWWKKNEKKYPRLAKLARLYLCIPATSASSERLFSTAGNIVNSKRSSLLPENVNTLAFLYKNKNI